MREAIAGTWLFGIVITFIVMFTSFLAYSISYTKAFNLKNEILNLIERHEGFSTSKLDLKNASDVELENDNTVAALAYLKIKNMGYNYTIIDNQNDKGTNICNTSSNTTGTVGEYQTGGYCVYYLCTKDNGSTKLHYKVTTFIALEIPVINLLLRIPISGEIKTLYYDINRNHCE